MKIRLDENEVDRHTEAICRDVAPTHGEVWDTEPRGLIRAVLKRWRLPNSVDAWEMYTDEGNRFVHDAVRTKMNSLAAAAAQEAGV